MADDEKKENKKNIDGNITKCYQDIEFCKVEDTFNVAIQYDSNSDSISLKFINQTTKSVFKYDFSKENVDSITSKYKLKPQLLVKMIMDSLGSKERVAKNLRIFILPNMKQASDKCKDIQSLEGVPEAINIPKGFKPKVNTKDKQNNQMENCLLFVLHFSAPPIIYLNYCFNIPEKDISEYDKLSMKFDDLQKESLCLKDTVKTQKQQIDQLIQTNNVLTQRVQEVETKIDNNEQKTEVIELNMQNNWVKHDENRGPAKAMKVGKIIFLQGLIMSGTSGVIATLPEGWRPVKNIMFNQRNGSGGTRVDVHPDGRIIQSSTWTSWLSLNGISFVVQ